ncbi:hypothetical protein [Nisaea sp.]|uniref:hypothetical protein n=1 Tax=Nisaea sp. TaxID=2024842 RepID=UPI002B26EE90|nr:hypothetical protein [Nisaea sp.]
MDQIARFHKLRVTTRDGDLITEMEKRDPDQLIAFGRKQIRAIPEAEIYVVLDPDGRAIANGGTNDESEIRTDVKRGDRVDLCDKTSDHTILLSGTVRAIGLRCADGVPLIEIEPYDLIANGTRCTDYMARVIFVPATVSANERADLCLRLTEKSSRHEQIGISEVAGIPARDSATSLQAGALQ